MAAKGRKIQKFKVIVERDESQTSRMNKFDSVAIQRQLAKVRQ